MLKPEYAHIKNIIFDIGDVIVDIDYNITIAAFQQLAHVDFAQIVSYSKQEKIFDRFEKGQITADEFRSGLKKYLKPDVTDEQITAAWNTILVNYPIAKFELLEKLKHHYKVFALSNINEIHAHSLDVVAQQSLNKNSFRDFFHHAYYSHEMGYRKPEPEIYTTVLREQQLQPFETLFFDDKAENVEAALAQGIQAIQLKDRNRLFDFFI